MKKIVYLALLVSSALWAEPSAFKAGDLSVDKPYGLTENEKLLLNNINSVKYLKRDKNMIHSDVDQMKSDIDGLRSILNSLSQAQQKTQKLIKKILETQDELEVSSLEYKDALVSLDSNISNLLQNQVENYKKIKNNFGIFEERLIVVENKYVSKKSFDALQGELNALRTLITTQFKKLNKGSGKKSSVKSGSTLFKEGKSALKAKKYKRAVTRFIAAIDKKYKPASSHFYAGEAYYQQKKYKQAVSFFKESYKRYKKGSYNAKLFLHMGISLNKLGQKKKAKKVLKTLVKKYPKTSYAKAAKKYL